MRRVVPGNTGVSHGGRLQPCAGSEVEETWPGQYLGKACHGMLGPEVYNAVRKPWGMRARAPWRPYRRYRSSWYIIDHDHPHPAPQFSDPYVVFGPAIYPVCVDSERTSLTPTDTVISGVSMESEDDDLQPVQKHFHLCRRLQAGRSGSFQ
jgi:hypothetical protein